MKINIKYLTYLFFIILFSQSNLSFSCSHCVESMFYYTFPFMYYAIIVLAIWRIAYAIWQYNQYHPSLIKVIEQIFIRILILFFLFILTSMAGFFIYLIASFIKAFIVTLIDYKKKVNIKLIKHRTTFLTMTLVILLISIVFSYIEYSQMNTLGKFKRYIHPGTAFGRSIIQNIINDKNFDINNLKEMILSNNTDEVGKAFEILYERNSFEDLIYFQDIILNLKYLEESLPNVWTKNTIGYFQLWLSSLGAKDIKTKEDLKNWIEKEKQKRSERKE